MKWLGYIPYCGRIKVFLSYSRSASDIAEKVYEHLKINNADVFFDQVSIDDINYGRQIRQRIKDSDFFVLLISRDFLANKASYAFAEYTLAKDFKKKKPERIVPAIIDESVTVEELDHFLKARNVIVPSGDIAFKITSTIQKLRPVRRICTIVTIVALLAIAIALLWLFSPPLRQVEMLVPEEIEFRPLIAPPEAYAEENHPETTEWLTSQPGLYALRLGHSHLSERGELARMESSRIFFSIDGKSFDYNWQAFTCILEDCPGIGEDTDSQDGIDTDWLAQRSIAQEYSIPPGHVVSNEVLYTAYPAGTINYKEMVDLFLSSKVEDFHVDVYSTVQQTVAFIPMETEMHITCEIDLAKWRTQIKKDMEEVGRYTWWTRMSCDNPD